MIINENESITVGTYFTFACPNCKSDITKGSYIDGVCMTCGSKLDITLIDRNVLKAYFYYMIITIIVVVFSVAAGFWFALHF